MIEITHALALTGTFGQILLAEGQPMFGGIDGGTF